MDALQRQELKVLFRGELSFDFPLRELVSYKVGGPAEVVAFPRDLEDLIALLRFIRNAGIPFVVFGEGTNLLVRDDGVRGVVIKLSPGFGKISADEREGDQVRVHAAAGVRLGELIKFSRDHSLSGLEFAAGIPGSVGGAMVMNAGAYGGEIKDVTHAVSILNSNGWVNVVPREELTFSYRGLRLPHDAVILEAIFSLSPGVKEEIAARIQSNLQKRKASQPLDLPSAGSVFMNPPGAHAGALIEAAGLKGFQVGGAAISSIHANYIVNCGGATARDILALISVVQERVRRDKGITLEPEIRVIGED